MLKFRFIFWNKTGFIIFFQKKEPSLWLSRLQIELQRSWKKILTGNFYWGRITFQSYLYCISLPGRLVLLVVVFVVVATVLGAVSWLWHHCVGRPPSWLSDGKQTCDLFLLLPFRFKVMCTMIFKGWFLNHIYSKISKFDVYRILMGLQYIFLRI